MRWSKAVVVFQKLMWDSNWGHVLSEATKTSIYSGEFGDVVAGSLEEFVVANGVATEIAELIELRKGCSNRGLGGCDFVVRDRAERGF